MKHYWADCGEKGVGVDSKENGKRKKKTSPPRRPKMAPTTACQARARKLPMSEQLSNETPSDLSMEKSLSFFPPACPPQLIPPISPPVPGPSNPCAIGPGHSVIVYTDIRNKLLVPAVLSTMLWPYRRVNPVRDG